MLLISIAYYVVFFLITFWFSGLTNYKLEIGLELRNSALLRSLYLWGAFVLSSSFVYYNKYQFQFLKAPIIPDWGTLLLLTASFVLTIIMGIKAERLELDSFTKTCSMKYRTSKRRIVSFLIIRLTFLVVYELFFRGILLYSAVYTLGITYGVLINIGLYTLVHFSAKPKVILACIPFGLYLCGITIWLSSVWPAVVFHCTLALVGEGGFLLKFNNKGGR